MKFSVSLFVFGSRILMRTWELFTMELNIQPCYSITRSSFCLSVGSTLEQIRTLGKWHFSQHWCLNTSRIWELIKAMLEPLFSADKIACQVSSFSMNETGGQFAWSLISFPPVHKTGLTAQVCVFHLTQMPGGHKWLRVDNSACPMPRVPYIVVHGLHLA